ncbi:hypothetical protein KM043_004890 [Ampulex compressa]|nr:hypothetical protein KM043_004890 [Ampulex compressa]
MHARSLLEKGSTVVVARPRLERRSPRRGTLTVPTLRTLHQLDRSSLATSFSLSRLEYPSASRIGSLSIAEKKKRNRSTVKRGWLAPRRGKRGSASRKAGRSRSRGSWFRLEEGIVPASRRRIVEVTRATPLAVFLALVLRPRRWRELASVGRGRLRGALPSVGRRGQAEWRGAAPIAKHSRAVRSIARQVSPNLVRARPPSAISALAEPIGRAKRRTLLRVLARLESAALSGEREAPRLRQSSRIPLRRATERTGPLPRPPVRLPVQSSVASSSKEERDLP